MTKTLLSTLILFLFIFKSNAQNAAWRNIYVPDLPLSSNITDLAIEKDSNLYIIVDETSLYRYHSGIWTKMPNPTNNPVVLKHLTIDNQGGVWMSMSINNSSKGLARWYNNAWQFYNSSNSIIIADHILMIGYDSTSKLMVFCTANEVISLDVLTNRWTNIGIPSGHPTSFFDADRLAISKKGDWYFSSYSFLSVYIYQNPTRTWRQILNLPNNTNTPIYPIVLDSSNIPFTIIDGSLARYDTFRLTWTQFPFAGVSFTRYQFDKNNTLWVFSDNGTNREICRIDSLKTVRKYTRTNSPLQLTGIKNIVVSPNNLKYIFGGGNLIQIIDDSLLPSNTENNDESKEKMIANYNNPIEQSLILTINKTLVPSNLSIQIHDSNGRLFAIYKNIEPQGNQIELSTASLPHGVYFLTCTDIQNQKRQTIKVVK